jgi:Asp-tRNA(Asn)/Glu-tRNA(Gln) amidotransferase A subunit family amidase
MVPLAFGSQTAASVIRPAAFCGIVGFKPTIGRVATAGVKTLSPVNDTVGGFGRTVQDAALFAAAMTGDARLLDIASGGIPRVGLCRTHQWREAAEETRSAMHAAGSRLARAGAAVADVSLPESYVQLNQVQSDIMTYEQARNLSYERLCHADQLSPALLDMMRAGMAITPEQHGKSLALAFDARQMTDMIFGEHDVLIAPSAIGEAPHGLDSTGNPVFCRMWTMLGLPCVHVPFARGPGGLPVGVQVIGRFGMDRQTLQAAYWIHLRLTDA